MQLAWIGCDKMGINFYIVCSNRHSMRSGKEKLCINSAETGKSIIVTHGTIKVNNRFGFALFKILNLIVI